MRMLAAQIFDDVIAGSTFTWYSSAELNEIIGSAETIVFQACTTGVNAGSTLTVQGETSADNQTWQATTFGPEINGQAIANDGSYAGRVNDLALLTHVRFKITLGGATPKCRLKLYVTGRVAAGAGAS